LEHLTGPHEFIATAAMHARDVDSVCQAVGTIIALKSIERPSEAMLSSVNTFLWNAVLEIEQRLRPYVSIGEQNQPTTWELLRGSGLLTDPVLVDYAIARFAEKQLHASVNRGNDTQELEQLAIRLLHHDNPLVVAAAQDFQAASSKQKVAIGVTLDNFDPQLLHKLCWNVIAAWEILEGQKDPASANAARELLSNHDEARTLRSAARKLIFFLDNEDRKSLTKPQDAGIYLFVAFLAKELGIDHDHVIRLAASQSIAPLAMMLRAVEMDQEQAMEILFLLKGFDLRPIEVTMFEQNYASLSELDALQSIQSWRADRARLLLGIERDDPVAI
jgi:hypothetical protein